MSNFYNEISIITPIYNGELFLENTIQSIINQTHKNWKMYIVDDCSTDRTSEIALAAARKDERIRYMRMPRNEGAAAARNAGITAAEGRYIAFLDGDDAWLPEKLEKQLNFMESNNIPFTYSAYYAVKGNIKVLRSVPQTATFNSLLLNCYIGCLTVIYDTQKLGKVYMPGIAKRQDWATWLQIFSKIHSTKGITEPLAEYNIRSQSLSSNKFKLIKHNWKVMRMFRPLPVAAPMFFVFLVINTLKTFREKIRFMRKGA